MSFKIPSHIDQYDNCHLEFFNNSKRLSLWITSNEKYKNQPFNESIDDHFLRDDTYYIGRWLNFISKDEGEFTFRYRVGKIINGKLIITNDESEVEYYGYEVGSFDIEKIRKITNEAIEALKIKETPLNLLASEYIISLKQDNLMLEFNDKSILLLSNVKHHGDTWYGSKINRMNKSHMKENIEDLKNGTLYLRFRNLGREILHIKKQDKNYIFIPEFSVIYSLEENESLQIVFDKLASMKW